jgi:hypothetical protein
MKKLVLAIALLVAIPVMLVGCAKSQVPAVKDTLNEFAAAYNSEDFDKCTDYLLGITDEATKQGVIAGLQLGHQFGGDIEVNSIENVKIDKSTATATVKITVMSTERTIELTLTKTDGTWKFGLGDLLQG